MTPLEAFVVIVSTGLFVGVVTSNVILFREYIDAFLLGFVVSQIFRDSKKRVKKVTQMISDKLFYLSDDFQNSIGTITLLLFFAFLAIFFTFFWSRQCLWEAKEASQKFVQWVEITLSKESLKGSSTSAKNTNHVILAFLNEKKDMLKSYIEMVEDHTVNTSTISDGSKLIIEGSTFSVEYFSKLGSLIMNSTLRQELLDRADGGIEIQQYIQAISEVLISSALNVILVAGDILLNLSAFLVALYYNLLHEKDFIQNLFHDVIPLDRRLANEISRSISDTLEDIIMLPVHIGAFRVFSTWLMFHAISLPFPYFATLLMMFSALIPVLSTIVVLLPWIAGMIFVEQWLKVCCLLVFGLYILPAHDALEYKKGLRMHPYIISLSILTGFRHFGFTGILYGPLILCSGKLLYITAKKLRGTQTNFLVGSDEAIAAALEHYNSRYTVFGSMGSSVDAVTSIKSTNIGQLKGESKPSSPPSNVVSEKPLSRRTPEIEKINLNPPCREPEQKQNTGKLDLPPFMSTTRRNTTIGVDKSKNVKSKSSPNLLKSSTRTNNINDASPFIVANQNGSRRFKQVANDHDTAEAGRKQQIMHRARTSLEGLIKSNRSKLKSTSKDKTNQNKASSARSNKWK